MFYRRDLLLAIERRLGALRQSLYSTLSRALGCAATIKLVSNVEAFCQYFGATEMGYVRFITRFNLCESALV